MKMSAPVFDVKFSPWREEAVCIDVVEEVSFFPDPEDRIGIARAKTVCSICPVAGECLTWALETNQAEGVWGGHTAKERRALRRRWLEEIQKAS
jgi:WhiB family transcriptional regulator, redox-sensing transcriptional regulator